MAMLPSQAQQSAPAATSDSSAGLHGKLLQVPVTTLAPGGTNPRPTIKTPPLDDPAAAQRGMQAFNALNCVGCHMANGGGGMGPALSNNFFIYGGEPENIYLSIAQGRPNGMPVWGSMLPDPVIWDLVAYITSISKAPTPQWGTTVSASSPQIQQVPAEDQQTASPWDNTESFTKGQKPD
ncbi:MAG: cytochrome c [Xanthobacteraceae bacterium]|nr:cytochrome c [Xanthobacteraceae bacterium]